MQEKTRTSQRNALITDGAAALTQLSSAAAAGLPLTLLLSSHCPSIIAFNQRQNRVNGFSVILNTWFADDKRRCECACV